MKRALVNAMSVFLGIVAFFLCLEIALRLTGIFYRNATPQAGPKDARQFVIMCIGDSFVQGLGAPPEESYPRQLEELLNQEHLPKRVTVINSGMAGKNIEQIYERFRGDIETIRPDLVIFLGGAICEGNLYGYYTHIEGQTPIAWLKDQLYSIRTYKLMRYLMRDMEKRRHVQGLSVPANDPEFVPDPLLPRESQAAFEQGKRYNDKGEYAKAISAFQRSIALCPEQNPSYPFLTQICGSYGKYDEALAWYEKGCRAHLQYNRYTYCDIGKLYLASHNIDKAYEMFRKGFETSPAVTFNCNFDYLIKLYYDNDPEKRRLRGDIRQYLTNMRNKTTRDHRKAIELLNDNVDVRWSIHQWRLHGIDKIIDLCQTKGIPIILQDYPEIDVYEDIARKRSVPFVCHSKVFAELLKHEPRSTYFASDGSHCNATGYRVMARNLCTAIMEMKVIQ